MQPQAPDGRSEWPSPGYRNGVNVSTLKPKPPVIVETPRGLARLVGQPFRTMYGYDAVNVRMSNTGSPWTFRMDQVKVVRPIE